MPAAIDTLNIYTRLKSTGLSEESAKEIAEVFRETIEENLATKNDLKTTESNLTNDLKITESNLTKFIESVRFELKTTESNLTKYIESVRSELKKDIESLRSELKKDIELVRFELRKEIAESKAGIIKWVAGMLVAQAALIATLVKLL